MSAPRTSSAELHDLVDRLGRATNRKLHVERYQPGDSRTPYRIVGDDSQPVFGERRRSAAELADCIRFALRAMPVVPFVCDAVTEVIEPSGLIRHSVEIDGYTYAVADGGRASLLVCAWSERKHVDLWARIADAEWDDQHGEHVAAADIRRAINESPRHDWSV